MKTTIPPLPADLRRVLWKRNVLPFLLYGAWLVLLTSVSFLVIYPLIAHTDSMVVAPTIFLAACILPIFILKLPQKLMDRSYWGTVRSCKAYNYREPIVLRTRNDPNYIPRAEIVVEASNGKLIPLNLPLPDPYAPPPWKEGDKVVHFRGSSHLILAEKLPTTCIVCYGISPDGSEQCVFCSHSLIRNSITKETVQ